MAGREYIFRISRKPKHLLRNFRAPISKYPPAQPGNTYSGRFSLGIAEALHYASEKRGLTALFCWYNIPTMEAKLIKHDKITDELSNTTEIKMWSVPKSADKPYGFKYSLVYIVNSTRIIGYDNAEGKGDHRHYKDREEPYRFDSLEKLAEDFYRDVERIKREIYENQKSTSGNKRH